MAYISFQPNDYFNTVLYDGNGSTNARTGLGFEPDWIWIKNNTGDHDHYLFDQVRGATKHIRSNTNNAEGTASGVTSFDSDGFTLGSSDGMNENGRNFVAWNWRASGSQGSSNTDGTINTTYTSANTTSGFSISTYTGNATQGASIGHSLGVAPAVVLVKRLDTSADWVMYHKGIGASKFIVLNTTAAEASSAGIFYNTAPTASLFYVGDDGATNASGGTYVAYCFAEKTGFSKFGSYTGNGNADGVFIYTGFKPNFFMWKRSSSSGGWYISDAKRDTFNEVDKVLSANDSGSESDQGYTFDHDFLSNGIKIRNTVASANSSGETFIYMAFAEAPLVSSNGVPATAR